MKIKVALKKLDDRATIPTKGSDYSAGSDLFALSDQGGNEEITIRPGETVKIRTGISIALPENTVGLIFARSGLSTKSGLAPANKVGVIDSDYRGELIVALYNQSDSEKTVRAGDRIAQIVIVPHYSVSFFETDSLDETSRGVGGFGSSGK